jgi:hypothetical protein
MAAKVAPPQAKPSGFFNSPAFDMVKKGGAIMTGNPAAIAAAWAPKGSGISKMAGMYDMGDSMHRMFGGGQQQAFQPTQQNQSPWNLGVDTSFGVPSFQTPSAMGRRFSLWGGQ